MFRPWRNYVTCWSWVGNVLNVYVLCWQCLSDVLEMFCWCIGDMLVLVTWQTAVCTRHLYAVRITKLGQVAWPTTDILKQENENNNTFSDTHIHFRLPMEISRKIPGVCGGLELKKSNFPKQECLDSQPMQHLKTSFGRKRQLGTNFDLSKNAKTHVQICSDIQNVISSESHRNTLDKGLWPSSKSKQQFAFQMFTTFHKSNLFESWALKTT